LVGGGGDPAMWRRSVSVSPRASPAGVPSTAGSCRSSTASAVGWLRAAVARTRPGAFLLARLDSFKRRQRDDGRRRVTNAQLRRLNRKIVSSSRYAVYVNVSVTIVYVTF